MVVLFMLAAPLLIGFLVGYTSEAQPRHFAFLASAFVLFLTATVYLIWEVDRPTEGLIRVNRQNLADLAERLRGSPRRRCGAGASPLGPAWSVEAVPARGEEDRSTRYGRFLWLWSY
jgi:hypothetical protein